ncbi:MAG TPA: hypothetical protein VMW91_07530 [Desulfosporosinus sp.]|nr:hypothetical protein [Desulfosporosinus sp.]
MARCRDGGKGPSRKLNNPTGASKLYFLTRNREKGSKRFPFLYLRWLTARLLLLPTGKDIWNLEQTLYANGLAFKLLNLHGFTTKDTGLESCFFMREAFKGNNNS